MVPDAEYPNENNKQNSIRVSEPEPRVYEKQKSGLGRNRQITIPKTYIFNDVKKKDNHLMWQGDYGRADIYINENSVSLGRGNKMEWRMAAEFSKENFGKVEVTVRNQQQLQVAMSEMQRAGVEVSTIKMNGQIYEPEEIGYAKYYNEADRETDHAATRDREIGTPRSNVDFDQSLERNRKAVSRNADNVRKLTKTIERAETDISSIQQKFIDRNEQPSNYIQTAKSVGKNVIKLSEKLNTRNKNAIEALQKVEQRQQLKAIQEKVRLAGGSELKAVLDGKISQQELAILNEHNGVNEKFSRGSYQQHEQSQGMGM